MVANLQLINVTNFVFTFQSISDVYSADWLNFTLPKEETSTNYLGSKKPFDGCKMFKLESDPKPLNSDVCYEENFSINETESCQNYIYDNTYFDETVATKFDLVCDKEFYKNLLQTVLILGLLVGSLAGGTLGDKFGRKKAMFGAIALTIPLTVGSCFVDSYNSKLLH